MMSCNTPALHYPETIRNEVYDEYFGTLVHDPYRWLEQPESEAVNAWVKAQNEVTYGFLSAIPFRQKIRERLEGLYNYSRQGVPIKKAGRYFFLANNGLQNHDVLYYVDSLGGIPVELLNVNTISESGDVSLSEFSISKEGQYIAYSLARGGSDWLEIYIKEVNTLRLLPEKIRWVKFSPIAWHGRGFFYSRFPEPEKSGLLTSQNKNHKVYYHRLGTDQKDDRLVFESPENPDRMLRAVTTDDERFLVISESESTYGTRQRLFLTSNLGGNGLQLTESFDYENSIVAAAGNSLYLLTNRGAPRFKLQEIVFRSGNKFDLRDLIPEGEHLLKEAYLAGDKLVLKYLQDAHARLSVFDLEGVWQQDIILPGPGDVPAFKSSYGEEEAFFSFTSYNHPTTVYALNMLNNLAESLFKPAIAFDQEKYITEIRFYQSNDGTQVPMYITRRKDLPLNGKNPAILYGYGGFNISITPLFREHLVFWLEQGGIYAVANIRGGGEFGEAWHKAGIKLNKQNVFDDFIAGAEFLIREKYTSPKYLAIEGRSNGGLLIGAVINQRPNLFAVALPGVGVMDMLRFSKFTIGWAWESDYGSVAVQEEFENLLRISPLHNLSHEARYPAVMVTTAARDDRVVPAHSFKYMAALQHHYKGPNPVLIRIQEDAGHGAGKPVSEIVDERADIYSFILHVMKQPVD